jgi:hypothetical protein
MKSKAFDRSEHVYKNDAFAELVKDAIRFFNGTPVHTLLPPEPFLGTGVYAIYYTGKNPAYKKYAELNRLSYSYPIYAGKAVPKGWRQARVSDNRYEQAKSDWDVIHPGRAWAEKCNSAHAEESAILTKIKNHFKHIERKP